MVNDTSFDHLNFRNYISAALLETERSEAAKIRSGCKKVKEILIPLMEVKKYFPNIYLVVF